MPDRPNIVYILIDNLGWGDIGVQGGSVPTPRIDQVAEEGAASMLEYPNIKPGESFDGYE